MRCRIYQTDNRDWVFQDWDWAMTHGFDQAEYERVYDTRFGEDLGMDDIYEIFNIRHPEDYRARSLSMSDVVAISEREYDPYDEVCAYYADACGFEGLTHDFWEDGLFDE